MPDSDSAPDPGSGNVVVPDGFVLSEAALQALAIREEHAAQLAGTQINIDAVVASIAEKVSEGKTDASVLEAAQAQRDSVVSELAAALDALPAPAQVVESLGESAFVEIPQPVVPETPETQSPAQQELTLGEPSA